MYVISFNINCVDIEDYASWLWQRGVCQKVNMTPTACKVKKKFDAREFQKGCNVDANAIYLRNKKWFL